MTTTKTYTQPGAPFDALALYALLAISLMVAGGVLGLCCATGGAAFFFIASAIVAISIYPAAALFVAEPWRCVVTVVSGLVGSGIYVSALGVYYQSQGMIWNIEFILSISVFFLLAILPAVFSAGTLILVGQNIYGFPLTVVSFSEAPSDGFLWRVAEALRHKAVERRSVELSKEERRIQGETALIRARTEAQLTSAKAKYLNSLTESERATLQLRMEAMARADVSVARHVERLEAENAELRRDLAHLLKR